MNALRSDTRLWKRIFHSATAKFKAWRVGFAYVLFFGYKTLDFFSKFVPEPFRSTTKEVCILLLGGIILQLISEIYTASISEDDEKLFARFVDCKEKIVEEIVRVSRQKKLIHVRYLGLSGFHWQDIRREFEQLLTKDRIKDLKIEFLFVDPAWDQISILNRNWAFQCNTTVKWIKDFERLYESEMKICNWVFSVFFYRLTPQIWGIAVNEDFLIFGTAYWLKYTDSQKGSIEYDLRGGSNPVEIVRSIDGYADQERIGNFIGWFEHFIKNRPLPIYTTYEDSNIAQGLEHSPASGEPKKDLGAHPETSDSR